MLHTSATAITATHMKPIERKRLSSTRPHQSASTWWNAMIPNKWEGTRMQEAVALLQSMFPIQWFKRYLKWAKHYPCGVSSCFQVRNNLNFHNVPPSWWIPISRNAIVLIQLCAITFLFNDQLVQAPQSFMQSFSVGATLSLSNIEISVDQ